MAERVKGVRDFTGKEAVLRQEVIQKIRESYELFGFQPLETPILEYLSLFTEKSGPEIENQLYAFEDKKGEKLALRPEHTVSRLRVVSENRSITKPLKAYGIGNVWRYEDVAKGRYREFLQADIDIYGSSSAASDAEIVACIDFTLKRLGLGNYTVHINNRKVLQSLLDELVIPVDSGYKVLRELDKIDKVGMDAVMKSLSEFLDQHQMDGVRDFLEGRLQLKSEVSTEVRELVNYLDSYGIKDTVIDNSLVRGLDYYDGNIFEFVIDTPEYKGTIAGGGRYDKLSKKFGVTLPVVGCAIGFERIMEIFKSRPTENFSESYCVINVDNSDKAIEIAQKLRKKDQTTDLLIDIGPLSKGLDYCNSKGIRYAVIVGNKDLSAGEITLRDLKEKKEAKIKESEI